MLRVRVCAAYMGGFFSPKFSKQEFLFWHIFHKHGRLSGHERKIAEKMCHFQPKYIIKVGKTATVGNGRG